jgi:hypothetical protein
MLSEESFNNHARYLMKASHTYIMFMYNYYFYFNPYTKFDDLTFEEPKTLESFNSKNVPMD